MYASYLALTLLGLVTAALLHVDGLGTSGASAAGWWRGDDVATYAKSYRQLAELTHFHLFTEPVALLVVAHLYALGSDTGRRKVVAIVATAGAILLQVALPWVCTYVTGAVGILFLPVHIVLMGGFCYMIARAAMDLRGPRT